MKTFKEHFEEEKYDPAYIEITDHGHVVTDFSYILSHNPELKTTIKKLMISEAFSGRIYNRILNAKRTDLVSDAYLTRHKQFEKLQRAEFGILMHFKADKYEFGFRMDSYDDNHKRFYIKIDNRYFSFQDLGDGYDPKEVDEWEVEKIINNAFCNYLTYVKFVKDIAKTKDDIEKHFDDVQTWILFQ